MSIQNGPVSNGPVSTVQNGPVPYVCIYASQVAVCIGANRHKKASEAMEAMWYRISPHGYYAALERNGLKTEDQNIIDIMARHLEVKGLVDKSLTLPCGSSDQVAQNYGCVSKDLDSVDLDSEEKRLVDDVLKRNLYTTYGNRHEQGMIDHIRTRLGIKCRQDPAFHKQLAGYSRGGVPWYIGGKIDAISEDGETVIELKNRVNRLFFRAPYYEVIQVQTYLQLLDVERGALVECLQSVNPPTHDIEKHNFKIHCGAADLDAVDTAHQCAKLNEAKRNEGQKVHVNVIPIARDKELWTRTIAPKLEGFVDFLMTLLNDVKAQDRYLQSKRRSVLVLHHMTAWEKAKHANM